MNDKELKEFIAKGYIHCRVIFEMAGNPKEHVEKTLRQYISAIKEDPSYIFLEEKYEPCEVGEDGIWSTFVEADIHTTDLEALNRLCFNMSPASVEIIEPESLTLTQKRVGEWYNDVLSKIHEIGVVLKNTNGENELLKVNINRLIRNCITLALNEPKTIEELGTKVGIDKEHLQPFIDAMLKEKNIIRENDKFKVNK